MKANRATKLFTGYDQGHYTSPEAVLDQRRRLKTSTCAAPAGL